MNKNILLSICMIVKNEEENIEKCLKSMMPLINEDSIELIIVDTGSIDKTVDICKKYTKHVYNKQWNDDFSEARNYSISIAKGEYIFIQDADQTIDEKSVDRLINLFKNKEYRNYNTIYIKLRNYLNEKLDKFSELRFPLIFKNDGDFKYTGAVHNQPIFKKPIMYSDIQINHYGYIMNEEKRLAKFNRTATILKKELEREPDNYYYRFQLAKSYNSIGDYNNAMIQVDYYMKYIIDSKNHSKDDLKYYRTAAQTYYINDNFDKTIYICNRVLDGFPNFLDFIYLKGLSLGKKEIYEESNKELSNYLKVLDRGLYLENNEVEMFSISSRDNAVKTIEKNRREMEFSNHILAIKSNLKVLMETNIEEAVKIIEELKKMEKYNNIKDLEFFSITSVIYFLNMNYEKALEEVDKGLSMDNNSFDLVYNKACILEGEGNFKEAIKCYDLARRLCNDTELLLIINNKLKESK
ncbi:glycosyltransferase [Clostridium sp.]|uniref:TPR domain-containing glycosyltransferase n=1 Tax=Clostridium sp. TaxID=1506 RepID=UPI003217DEB1